jgi:hypothetical protein
MGFDYVIDGNFVVGYYDRLRILGVRGEMKMGLDEVADKFRDKDIKFVVAQKFPIVLNALNFFPPIDIGISRGDNCDSTILTYSLSEERQRRFTEEIITRTGFVSTIPDDDYLVETISEIVDSSYKPLLLRATSLARVTKKDLGTIFGAFCYSSLLQLEGVLKDENMRLCREKYGI